MPAGRKLTVVYTSAPDAGGRSASAVAEQFRAAGVILVVAATADADRFWTTAAEATGGFFAPAGRPVVGPALGLMGTLIPMGIALAGLAQGNLPRMAENMTAAFTATIVGLAASVVAYVLALVREHWLRADMLDIVPAMMAMSARPT